MAIRIYHCDDSTSFRVLVSEVLAVEDGLELVGQAADGAQAVAGVAAATPDVVLLDVVVDGGGDGLVDRLRAEAPQARILVLSGHPDPDALAGADARLDKQDAVVGLPAAIRALV